MDSSSTDIFHNVANGFPKVPGKPATGRVVGVKDDEEDDSRINIFLELICAEDKSRIEIMTTYKPPESTDAELILFEVDLKSVVGIPSMLQLYKLAGGSDLNARMILTRSLIVPSGAVVFGIQLLNRSGRCVIEKLAIGEPKGRSTEFNFKGLVSAVQSNDPNFFNTIISISGIISLKLIFIAPGKLLSNILCSNELMDIMDKLAFNEPPVPPETPRWFKFLALFGFKN